MTKSQMKPGPRGKRGINKARPEQNARPLQNPSRIQNKMKRSEMYGKYLLQKRNKKRELRKKRLKEAEALGDDSNDAKQHIKQIPRTLENTREMEQTMVEPNDEEVMADEAEDEFAPYFQDEIRPKILITTRPKPSAELFHFIRDLMRFIPKMYYYPRKQYSVKEICGFAGNKKFTHLIVLSEKNKVCNGMIISHLRPSWNTDNDSEKQNLPTGAEQTSSGPTAFFKISNVIPSHDIPNHGSATDHIPELVLNGFGTRLGHRAGRFLGSLFPHNAQFRGRQVATFHNQRDYIFVRHHRYVFEEAEIEEEKQKKKKKDSEEEDEKKNGKMPQMMTRLQELGPRFTMKMRWLQEGMFDTQFGEYEWIHKRKEMDTTRRKFHL